jgi:hypothetical protein
MATWSSDMSDALQMLSAAAADPVGLLTSGSDTQMKAVVALATMKNCTTSFQHTNPPSGDPAIESIKNSIYDACSSFEAASDDMTKGIDEVDPALVNRATQELADANSAIDEATRKTNAYAASH